MGFLKLASKADRGNDKKVLNKIKNARSANVVISSGDENTLGGKIKIIKQMVEKIFPNPEIYDLIRSEDKVKEYFDGCIDNKICTLDTETTSLDPITCTIAGASLYTPNLKPCYIPINHVDYITEELRPDQIDPKFLKEQFERLKRKAVKMIYHNAKYDIRVVNNQLNCDLGGNIYWDTQVAAHLLNENEVHKLKILHAKYIENGTVKGMSYDEIFESIPFTYIPIKTGYLYAAGDAIKTWELYEFQKEYLDVDGKFCKERNLEKLASLFRDVEIPLISVTANMEDRGVTIDKEYAKGLEDKYNKILVEQEASFYSLCKAYKKEIASFKAKNKNSGLADPINMYSSKQVGALLYDVLGLESPDKKKPRGTGEEILEKLDTPFSKAILDCRGTSKLLSTYITKLPRVVNNLTGKIHASFNQNGTVTGRYSSSNPNCQNIPSHNKDIRKMFVASEGNCFISGDFSQQEPRILAHMSKDERLIQAYKDGKDIYAFMGSFVFKVPYEDCLEFRPDGTTFAEGKERRSKMKAIVLGLMYGKEAKSTAESLKITQKEAEQIIKMFFDSFPKVKEFVDWSINRARQIGYVETAWGRRRRLPDLLLPDFEFSYQAGKSKDFDPLNFDNLDGEFSNEVDDETIDYYWDKLEKAVMWKDKEKIKAEAASEGIAIKDHRFKIGESIRQGMNAPIQGSAGDMIKNAMVCLDNPYYLENVAQFDKRRWFDKETLEASKRLKELGYSIILQVHDELILEGKKEHAAEAVKLLEKIMIRSAASVISVEMKVDPTVCERWYGEDLRIAV